MYQQEVLGRLASACSRRSRQVRVAAAGQTRCDLDLLDAESLGRISEWRAGRSVSAEAEGRRRFEEEVFDGLERDW